MEPNATGTVFASRQMLAAKNGSNPRPDQHGCGDGDRRSESGGCFDEATEAERDQQSLHRAILGDVPQGVLDNFKFAGLDCDPVKQDRGEYNPADGQDAVGRAVEG